MDVQALAGATELPLAVLDALPNPVLIKDHETRYVWVNGAFERLFQVTRDDLVGRQDKELFSSRQVAQCNGGDLRVLETGDTDEAYETVIDPELGARETITRKSRLELSGSVFLVGVMHDITEVTRINQQLEAAAIELEAQAAELRALAGSDPLTGCLNRRALCDVVLTEFSTPNDEGGLVLFDLDRFKVINDTFGHAAGDAALVHFTKLVKASIRDTDALARLGGEEFVAVLPGAAEHDVEQIAERVRLAVEQAPFEFGGSRICLTVSAGGVHRRGADAQDIDGWIAEADKCLYGAKSGGRNRSVIASAAAG